MNSFTLKSYSKINFHLGVLGKIKSGYHKIESFILFSDLFDKITIKEILKKEHKIYFYGKFSNGIPERNTIRHLLEILEKKKKLLGKKYLIKIQKNIPLKSGMGGGSMNAATILNYFIKRKIIKIKKSEIVNICSKIGSDVILGLDNKPKILKHNGKIVKFSKKLNFHLVFIKPSFGCNTKSIYKDVKVFSNSLFKIRKSLSKLKIDSFKNDLEKVSFKKYPQLFSLKKKLTKIPNILSARMTGSGSTLVGYFGRKKDALNGVKILKKKYKNHWCIVSKTI